MHGTPLVDTASTVTAGGHPGRWRILGLLAVAQFMLIVDVTVVTIALPQLGADLGLGRESLTWVMSAYTLTFGGLLLLGGRAADKFGAGRMVLTGLTVFTAASLAAALATSGETIIGARVAQGVGAALMSPAALSLVVRLFEGVERRRALGIWSALGGTGAAVGVLLGGVLTAGPGWEWVFLVNVPVGVVVAVALVHALPALPPVARDSRLDLPGALLVTAGTGLAILAFIGAGSDGWLTGSTLGLLAASGAAYAVLIGWLHRAADPILDPGLVARRPVAGGTFVLFVGTAVLVAVFFLGTFSLQEVAGLGPMATGVLFLPVALGTIIGAQVSAHLLGAAGGRALGVAGLAVASAALAVPAFGSGVASTVVAVSVGSIGLGALFVVAATTALGEVEPERAGMASGLLSTSHELGAALGAAVMSGVVATGLTAGSDAALDRGYLVAAALALCAAVVAAVVIPGRSATPATASVHGGH